MKILKLLGLAAIVGGVTAVAIYKLREKKLHECEEQTIVICKCESEDCTEECTCGCQDEADVIRKKPQEETTTEEKEA